MAPVLLLPVTPQLRSKTSAETFWAAFRIRDVESPPPTGLPMRQPVICVRDCLPTPDWTGANPCGPPTAFAARHQSVLLRKVKCDGARPFVEDGVNTDEYFGSSSAGSFTAQIKAAIGIRLGQSKQTSSPRSNGSSLASAGAARRKSMPSLAHDVLPPTTGRPSDEHLLAVRRLLYPFLDRGKWEHSYTALFAGTPLDTDERTFVATLDIIFALATQLVESLSTEQRSEASHVFFRRAQDLVELQLWDPGSLELIQYLLLTSQYLQSTNHPHQTWMVVGSAVRIAQSLGLHLPETSAAQKVMGRRELMRRDRGSLLRMVSLTHGRPAMVSEQLALAVPLPSLVSSPGADGAMPPVEVSFFVKSVELYEITHKVILSLYSGLRNRSSGAAMQQDRQAVDLGVLMQLDGAMSRWEDSLPAHLMPGNHDTTSNKIFHRQALILRIRFLHARMFLLRPALARMCLPQGSPETCRSCDSLHNRVMQQCAHFCVETAQSIIGLILEHQPSSGTVGLLPAWWYRVYYIFSAATVLIAAKLRPDLFPCEDVLRAWNRAMDILQTLGQLAPSAKRCVVALQILSSKIIQNAPDAGTLTPCLGPAPSPSRHLTLDEPSLEGVQATAEEQELPPLPDLDLSDVIFDVDDFSWLDDMNAWGLVNE
ncbi:hypothetical protein ACCO45_007300 [Purpureocillium lilacinum]|uniref:Uncharacterized protein n=1 Tax=Purpureocillium lilacinum TaxID=33203 RepID=A0ACC4DV19_PURLI